MLTTDYADERQFENRQREHTLRSVVSWDHLRRDWKLAARAGYIHTWMAYDYRRDPGNGILTSMTRSRSRINTIYGQVDGEYAIDRRWLFTASVAAYQHLVEQNPMKRMMNPMEVAHPTVWLCSDGASSVNGVEFVIDGGAYAR